MINVYDSRITDIINNESKYNPEIQALAYALQIEKQHVLDLAARTRTIAMIDQLPERILDVLAVELRTPGYSEDYPIDIKRTLVRGTLTFYKKLGTPEAVNWVVRSIFGGGEAVEWFDYEGRPYFFKLEINIPDSGITAAQQTDVILGVDACKNVRSWLELIDYYTHCPTDVKAGSYASYVERLDVWPEGKGA